MRFFVLFLCAGLFAGCSETPSISCDDPGVTSRVVEASRDVLKTQLFRLYLDEAGMLSETHADMTYAQFKEAAEGSVEAHFQEVMMRTEANVPRLTVSEVWTKTVDEVTGRVACAVDLKSDHGNTVVEFTALPTDNGDLEVELLGL